jgi:hypothetical protein
MAIAPVATPAITSGLPYALVICSAKFFLNKSLTSGYDNVILLSQ